MTKLIIEDRSAVLDLLIGQKMLQDSRGRATVLRNAGLDFLIPQIDLDGSTIIVVSEIIQILENYGSVTFGNDALGIFLSALKGFVGAEIQEFIDRLLVKYNLMTPGIKPLKIHEWKSHETGEDIQEAIVGENTLIPIGFFQQGLEVSRSVALILVNDQESNWAGTGFLIGTNILITNNHVLPTRELCETTKFRFNYELDFNGNPKEIRDYEYNSSGCFFTNHQMDFTVVELQDRPGDEWGVLKISHLPIESESRVNIIQHPGGMPKYVSFRNNFVKYVNTKVVQYVTTTLPGSSGSPVFSDRWEVIGLHHAGGYLVEPSTGMYYFRNEGILIKSIMETIPNDIRKLISYSV